MTKEKLVECLRYCIKAEGFADCMGCPFQAEPEFPEGNDVEALCADKLMEMAADMLEQG